MKGAYDELELMRGLLSFEWYCWVAKSSKCLTKIEACKKTLECIYWNLLQNDFIATSCTMKVHPTFLEDYEASFLRDESTLKSALLHYQKFIQHLCEWGSSFCAK